VISTGLTVDSLTIMDVIMELEDRFDVTIPMNVVAEIDTIDQLAETVMRLR
jgi:acyl carrier protein